MDRPGAESPDPRPDRPLDSPLGGTPAGMTSPVLEHDHTATTGPAVLAGGIWNAFTKVLPQLYTVLASVITGRFLGPELMGRQSFIAFVELSAVVLLIGGLPVALTRFIGEAMGRGERDTVRTLVRWAWRVEAVGALVAVAALAGIGFTRDDLQVAWYLAAVASGFAILHSVPTSLLSGTQQWREATLAGTFTGLIGVIGIFVVLRAGGGINGIFAVEAATAALNLGWTSLLSRRAVARLDIGTGTLHPPAPAVWAQLKQYAAVNTLIVALHYVVWRRSEFLFLARYSTSAEIAYYSIAFGGVAALASVAEAAGSVFAPAVATLLGAGQRLRIRAGYGRAVRLLLQLALPLTAAGLALGPAAVEAAYGSRYRPVAGALRILLVAFPLTTLASVSTGLLHGLGRFHGPLIATAAAAVANVSLAFVLVPDHGAAGAALANGVAQAIATVVVVAWASRLVESVVIDAGALARACVVAGGAGLAAYAAVRAVSGAAGLALGAAAGLALYLALALTCRPVSKEDGQWLRDFFERRVGTRVARLVARMAP